MESLTVVHSVHKWLPLTETWIQSQVEHLPAEIDSHVVCRSTANLDLFPCDNLHALSSLPRGRRTLDRFFRRLGVRRHLGFLVDVARQTGAAVIHSHFGNLGWENVHAAREADAKHVVTFYGYDVDQLPRASAIWAKRYRELFETVDTVLCEGPHMGRSIAALGCPPEKIRVHHFGIDVERLRFEPRLWPPGTPLRVLLAAGFREKKGLPCALAALGKLKDELPLEVTLIGDASRESSARAEKQRILETIRDCGLESSVRRLGFQPYSRLLEEAYRHHVFLSPSVTAADGDTEGGAPVALIEMAATGMPVVSTRHCDIPWIFEEGDAALLADERDVDGLVECLRRLTADAGLWTALPRRARRRLENDFDARLQGQRMAEIYRGVVAGVELGQGEANLAR